jgi:enolase
MNTHIQSIAGQEILDSRGNPTLAAIVTLEDGTIASAAVPSGASTGQHGAVELRDGDKKRYGGKGVLKAVSNVNNKIAAHLRGMDATQQRKIDDAMRTLDGSPGKANLGANAILGVSMAVCRAAAQSTRKPLYTWIRGLSGGEATSPYTLPMPMMNVLNGGAHARQQRRFSRVHALPGRCAKFRRGLAFWRGSISRT